MRIKITFIILYCLIGNLTYAQLEEAPWQEGNKSEYGVANEIDYTISKGANYLTAVCKKTNKHGVVDKALNIIVPFEFDKLKLWNAYPIKGNKTFVLSAEKDGHKLILDYYGNPVLGFEIDDFRVEYLYTAKLIWVKKKELEGYYDFKGNVLVPIAYTNLNSDAIGISKLNLITGKNNGKSGVFDLNTKKWKNLACDYIIKGTKDWLLVSSFGKQGIFSYPDWKVIVPMVYEKLQFSRNDRYDMLIAKKINTVGVIDMKNNVLIPFEYEKIEFPYELQGNLLVTKNKKIGIISIAEEILIPIKYDYIKSVKGKYLVAKDGKYGVISKEGVNLVPIKFDLCTDSPISNGINCFLDKGIFLSFDDNGVELKKNNKILKKDERNNLVYDSNGQKYFIGADVEGKELLIACDEATRIDGGSCTRIEKDNLIGVAYFNSGKWTVLSKPRYTTVDFDHYAYHEEFNKKSILPKGARCVAIGTLLNGKKEVLTRKHGLIAY